MNLLITGGAGFIGRFVAKECLAQGHAVRILDCYSKQIHGEKPVESVNNELQRFVFAGRRRSDLSSLAFVKGDVCDAQALEQSLEGMEAVIHLAAETGTGQSMYELSRYQRINIGGTALLVETLASGKFPGIRRVILASSRAVYGEGQYSCARCGLVHPPARKIDDMQAGRFEPFCLRCGDKLICVATPENAPRNPSSFYGLTKAVQEDILRMFSGANLSVFNLRFQNVFGEMQSLRNPYTGIISIFSGLARANQPIKIFEDGLESRDFIHVEDIARAVAACLIHPPREGAITLNLGSGLSTTVLKVAQTIVHLSGSQSPIEITGEFRVGDIRHARADISAAQGMLTFSSTITFEQGISRFLDWASREEAPVSTYAQSLSELTERGLLLRRNQTTG